MSAQQALFIKRISCLKKRGLAGYTGLEPVYQDAALGIVVFESEGQAESCWSTGFSGARARPDYSLHFSSVGEALLHRKHWIAGIKHEKTAKALRQMDRSEQRLTGECALKVGDVLMASWGYEQTTREYYEVTALVGQRSVQVHQLTKKTDSYDGQRMVGYCSPIKGSYIGEPSVCRVLDATGRIKAPGRVATYATKKESVVVEGVETFSPDSFSTYG
jgi:hypothetical protein